MSKLKPGYRLFNKKRYTRYNIMQLNSTSAKRKARSFRKQGYSVRIVKHKPEFRSSPNRRYTLYTRKVIK